MATKIKSGLVTNPSIISTLKKPSGWGARHTLALLGFCGFVLSYSMRFNLSIAIVAMVGPKRGGGSQHNSSSACANVLNQSESDKGDEELSLGEFHHWSEAEQGLILGCFFWGYVFTQIPGGILADKYGGKWPLGLGLLVTAVFAILTPIAARTHTYLLVICRVIQGLGEGLTCPAMHEILAYWSPPDERSRLASFVYAGSPFGTAITMVMSGYLIDAGILGGWPSAFYIVGVLTIIWFMLWTMFMHNRPSDHPSISKEELHYIQNSIGDLTAHQEKTPTPWLAIFTSLPVWAIVVGHVGQNWGAYTLLSKLPSYLSTVLHFDMKQNSWLSALPYMVLWIASTIIPRIADYFISHRTFSRSLVRKSCQIIAHIGAAMALIGASYSGCDRTLTVTLLTFAVGINGAVYAGYAVNHVDIAPRHAGILMGITNTFANFTGFLAPYVCGLIINHDPSLQNWQYVFFIAAAIYVVETIFYALFASTTEQKWNRGVK